MTAGLVSIVIPAFNAARFLGITLQSVFRQTYRDFEVIVVDDGSTDGTAAVPELDAGNVRVIRQANQGRSAARNRGIEEAVGEFVVFLDSDDLLEPWHLETLVAVMRESGCDLAYGKGEHWIPDGHPARLPFRLRYYEGREAWRIVLNDFIKASHAAMIRHGFLTETSIRFRTGLEFGEDWEFWIRLVLAGASVRFVDRVVAVYRAHASNTSRDLLRMDTEVLRWLNELEASHHEVIEKRGLSPSFRRARVRVGFRLAAVAVYLGHRRQGRAMLLSLVRSLPRFRFVDLARFPAITVLSLLPVPLSLPMVRVVFGQNCSLDRRLRTRLTAAVGEVTSTPVITCQEKW